MPAYWIHFINLSNCAWNYIFVYENHKKVSRKRMIQVSALIYNNNFLLLLVKRELITPKLLLIIKISISLNTICCKSPLTALTPLLFHVLLIFVVTIGNRYDIAHNPRSSWMWVLTHLLLFSLKVRTNGIKETFTMCCELHPSLFRDFLHKHIIIKDIFMLYVTPTCFNSFTCTWSGFAVFKEVREFA